MQFQTTNERIDFPKLLEELSIRISSDYHDYSPNEKILIETPSLILKTAETIDELIASFKLRQNVFFGEENSPQDYLDIDEFDSICDHLIIIDRMSNAIVGTYRINCSLYTSTFYSQVEFNLDRFLSNDSIKLELGRACIHEDFRNGKVIDLLWRGIAEYSKRTNAKYLFGCSSIKTTSPRVAYEISEYFIQKENCETDFSIEPTADFAMDFTGLKSENNPEIKKMIPALLRSYITAGAKVVKNPALDMEFQCIDFMTILDLENINSLYKRRYFEKQ